MFSKIWVPLQKVVKEKITPHKNRYKTGQAQDLSPQYFYLIFRAYVLNWGDLSPLTSRLEPRGKIFEHWQPLSVINDLR